MAESQQSKLIYIQRYLAIIRLLKRHPDQGISLKEIMNHVHKQFANQGIYDLAQNEETFKRDIREIRNLGYLIKYNRREKVWVLVAESNDYKIEEILDSFYILNSIGGDSGKPDFIFSEKRPYSGMEHFLPLRNAIQNRKIVQFDYQKYFPEETKTRLVEPYALKESRGRWYLLGFEKDQYQNSKAFCFDRIKELFVTDDHFDKNQKINWEQKYDHCFAMFTSETEPVKVVISLDKRDAHYVESKPIHHSQSAPQYQGDRVYFDLFIEITEDLVMELMSRSWSIEIIEPLSLRNRIAQLLQEALVRNQNISEK